VALVAPRARPPAKPFDYRPYLVALWLAGAAAISWRQIRETVRFSRFSNRSHPASDNLVAEVAVVANRLGVRVPDVRVLTGLTSPVIWCLWRPVLLWPAGVERRLAAEGERAGGAPGTPHPRRGEHRGRPLGEGAAGVYWC